MESPTLNKDENIEQDNEKVMSTEISSETKQASTHIDQKSVDQFYDQYVNFPCDLFILTDLVLQGETVRLCELALIK